RCLGAISASASVDVPNLHATLLVDGNVEEVQQVTADAGAVFGPSTTRAHWSARCYVRCCPVQPAVKGMGNVKMPEAIEVACISASGSGRAVKGDGGASSVGCHGGRVPDILEPVNGADVEHVLPRTAMVVRCGDYCGNVSISHGEV